MQVRFFLELVVFFINVFLFNRYLAEFVHNWNDLGKALSEAETDYMNDI